MTMTPAPLCVETVSEQEINFKSSWKSSLVRITTSLRLWHPTCHGTSSGCFVILHWFQAFLRYSGNFSLIKTLWRISFTNVVIQQLCFLKTIILLPSFLSETQREYSMSLFKAFLLHRFKKIFKEVLCVTIDTKSLRTIKVPIVRVPIFSSSSRCPRSESVV